MSYRDVSGPARSSMRRGFTLVELLVVIGIIGLLVAVLLPSLRKARLQALRIACASNMHQTMLAMQMYANQYKEYPVNGTPGEDLFLQTYNSYNNYYTISGNSGQPSHWRGYLVAGKYGSPSVLGCAAKIDEPMRWHHRGATSNWFEDYASLRKAPPYQYWGPGVDCLRASNYSIGIPDFAITGDNADARASRNYRTKGRHPILTDSFMWIDGASATGVGWLLTPHSFQEAGPSPGDWSVLNNNYDHTVGWTDGSVSTHVRRFRGGEPRNLFEYNWNQPQKKWGRS